MVVIHRFGTPCRAAKKSDILTIHRLSHNIYGYTYHRNVAARSFQFVRHQLDSTSLTPYPASMNSKHRRTLAAVFADPTSGTLHWDDIESLLQAAGAEVIEGRGSRVRFAKGAEVATFHRPHPAKEAKRYQVRDARDFLERIGVRP